MSRAAAVPVDPQLQALLPGADFADAFALVTAAPVDAVTAARRALAKPPAWAHPLMVLRDLLVLPLGLKTRFGDAIRAETRIGIFPVISAAPERAVLGFDDRHLDFRVVVDAVPDGTGSRITATTLVRTHGLPGKLYLAMVMPFHRAIVPAALVQAARGG